MSTAEADRLALGAPGASGWRRALRPRCITRGCSHGGRLPPTRLIVNDLAGCAARSLCPAIDGALAALRGEGADHVVFVSGSGPTVPRRPVAQTPSGAPPQLGRPGLTGRFHRRCRCNAGRSLRADHRGFSVRVRRHDAGIGHNSVDPAMSNHLGHISRSAPAAGVLRWLAAFCALVVAPAITAYRRPLQRVAVVILSMYVLAALIGVGVVVGALVVVEWPQVLLVRSGDDWTDRAASERATTSGLDLGGARPRSPMRSRPAPAGPRSSAPPPGRSTPAGS